MRTFTKYQSDCLVRCLWQICTDENVRGYFNTFHNTSLTQKYVVNTMCDNWNKYIPKEVNCYIVLCKLLSREWVDEWLKEEDGYDRYIR